MDGVIARLTTALVEGGDPNSLPSVRVSLETAGQGLKTLCDAAVKTLIPNTKGVWEEIAKRAVEPLIKAISDGVAALWTRHVEMDKLELETKKTQLGAAKWPRVWRDRRAIAAPSVFWHGIIFAAAFAERLDGPLQPPGAHVDPGIGANFANIEPHLPWLKRHRTTDNTSPRKFS